MIGWIITSSVLILVVMALRYVLKGKISLRLQYALWALVLLRLLIPVNLGHSHVSVMNAFLTDSRGSTGMTGSLGYKSVIPKQLFEATKYFDNVSGFEFNDISDTNAVTDTYGTVNSPGETAKIVWFAGIATIGLYFLISNIRFAVRLGRTRRKIDISNCLLSVYETYIIVTPCMFGLFRPAIYVTPEVLRNETMLRHVLEHEMTHWRHKDHIWSLLRCVCLVLHWYNPLVWMAAFYSMKDAELSCDEATIRLIGEEERIEYGRTIIDLTCTKSRMDKLLMTATTMTGSKKSIEERITLIAKKPKTALYISIIVFLVAVVAVGCTFTGAEMNEIEKWFPQPEIEDRDEHIHVVEPKLPKEISYPDNEQWEQKFTGFTSDKDGWFVGSPGVALGTSENYVYLTYDGGKTWKETGNVNNEWSRVLTAAAFADTNTGYLCFRYDIENIGRVYQTKDGGKTWKQLEVPIFATLVEDGVGEVRSIGFDGNENGKMEFYFRNRNNETREGAIQTLISKDKGQTWFLLPENQGIQEAGRADINGDGKDEYIYINKSQMNEGLATLSVGDGQGRELWSEQLSTSHAGWGQLFLCGLDGRQYLLRYNPAMFQGNATYVYTLFTLKDGKEKVFKTNSIEFDINGTKELDVPQMLSFADEINSLLTKSTLLISSNNGAFL